MTSIKNRIFESIKERKAERMHEPGGSSTISARNFKNGFTNGTKGFINGSKNGNGFTNGLTRNGRINGFTNGFTNGNKGKKNGLYNGLVNGLDRKTGLVNGNGFINGFRMIRSQRSIPLARKKPALRIASVVTIVAILIIVPFMLIISMPTTSIKIDGYFFDWDRAGYFHESAVTAQSNVDLRDYSVVRWQNTMYCYVSTADRMFLDGNKTPNGIYAMIDSDNDSSTGYIVDDLGADEMVEILGWNGSAQIGEVYEFSEEANRTDFNGFVFKRSAVVASSSNKLEFSFDEFTASEPTVRFFSKSHLGNQDESLFAIRYNKPAVRIITNLTMANVVMPGIHESLMTISIEAQKGDVSLHSFSFEKLGNASDFQLLLYDRDLLIGSSSSVNIALDQAIEVKEGYGKSLSLYVSMGSQISSSFGLSLNSSGVGINNGPVVVDEMQSGSKVAYVSEIPNSIIVDGAFADWANGYLMPDTSDDIQFANGTIGSDPSIDIQSYGMYSDGTDVAMYLSVADRICNGTLLPKDIELPVPSEGLPPMKTPELVGADIAGVIIDRDLNISTGANFKNILGADYLVFVAGKLGKVIQSNLFAWQGDQTSGEWHLIGEVKFGIDHWQMELSFDISKLNLGDLDMAEVGFFMTDWKEGTDYSDSFLPLAKWQIDVFSRAFGGIIINEVYNVKGQVDWIELYNTGSQQISLNGWILYDNKRIIASLGNIVLDPGQFYVITNLEFGNPADLKLVDNQGRLIDQIRVFQSKVPMSWARTGNPPYSQWEWLPATPDALNPGQVAIPEFSSILMPILAIGGVMLIFKSRRRNRKEDGGHD